MNQLEFTDEELVALKKEHAPAATDEQFTLWIADCKRRGLVPVRDVIMQTRSVEEYDASIHAKVRKNKSIYITTIAAFRKIAEGTGKYAGQMPSKWIYLDADGRPTIESEIPLPDPKNLDAPLQPWAARVTLLRKGFDAPITVVARFWAYAQTFKRNNEETLTAMWQNRGVEQLEKCAESLALRKGWPEELGGLYIAEELRDDPTDSPLAPEPQPLTEAPKAAVVPTVNHAPAVPTNEPRPGEEKPRTKKPAKDVKIEEVILDKVEVVAADNPKIDKTEPTVHAEIAEPVQIMDNPKPSSDRCRDLIAAGVQKDTLKAYILRVSGEKETKTVLPARWNEILTPLEALLSEKGKGAVNEFIAPPIPEPDEPF